MTFLFEIFIYFLSENTVMPNNESQSAKNHIYIGGRIRL